MSGQETQLLAGGQRTGQAMIPMVTVSIVLRTRHYRRDCLANTCVISDSSAF